MSAEKSTSSLFRTPHQPPKSARALHLPPKSATLSRALHQMIRQHDSEATISKFQGAFTNQAMANINEEFNKQSVVAKAWGVDVIASSTSPETRKILVRTGAPIPKDPIFL